MNRMIAMIGLAAALTLPLAAAGHANASCADRKVAGTVIGGVGGALIGNSLARGGTGAVLGGLGGAVLGHEVAGAGCHREYRSDRGGSRRYRETSGRYSPAGTADQPYQPAKYVYYDQYGDPVAEGPTQYQQGPAIAAAAYTAPGPCSTQMQSYYDSRGALVQRPVQVCAR